MTGNDILIILDKMGRPLNIDKDKINILKEMGYQLDENKKQVNMEEIVLLDLAIKKRESFIQIIAHTHCWILDDKDSREERHYFLYYTKASGSLSNILRDFVVIADKEIHECRKEIIENEKIESHFVFSDLKEIVSKEIPSCDESKVNEAFQCIEENIPLRINAKSIKKVMPFIINLDKKSQYLTYMIYNVERFSRESNVNIIINKNIDNDIELLNFGETHKRNVLPPVAILAPSVTTSFSDTEYIIKMLREIKDDVRQKDRMGAKKKIESLLKMAGG